MPPAVATSLVAFGFGGFCMLLGFYLIVKGIGDSESESSVRIVGVEVRASKVGPGILFAMFGLVIAVVSLARLPSDNGNHSLPSLQTPTQSPAPSALPSVASASSHVSSTRAVLPSPDVPKPSIERKSDRPLDAPNPRPSSPPTPDPETIRAAYRAKEARLLRASFTATGEGRCSDDLFESNVAAACNEQIGQLGPAFAANGPVVDVEYVRAMNTTDIFRIRQTRNSSLWAVKLSDRGRFSALASVGGD